MRIRPRPAAQPTWTREEMAILRGEQDRVPPTDLHTAAWQLALRFPSLTIEQCTSAVRLASELLTQQQQRSGS